MTDATNTENQTSASPDRAARESREASGLASLNARTAKRQQMLLAGIGAVLLAGGSWVFLGPDDEEKNAKSGDAKTIDTAGLKRRGPAPPPPAPA